jgi:hypothetical protein
VKRRLAVVALLVLALAAPLTASVGATDGTPENETDASPSANANESGYTLEELRRGGTTLSNAPESVRMTDSRQFWLIYWPAKAVTSDPGEDSKWDHVEPGTTVDRNAVYLRSILFSEETIHVKVVTWKRGERTIRERNTTRTVPVAENVTTARHKVTLGAGWPMAKVPLQQHNEAVQTTMWIEEYPSVRWRFEHESVPTTQSAGISSEGDYLVRLAGDVLLPALIGVFVVGWLVKRAISRAGVGPMRGYGFWIFVLGVATTVALLFTFDSLAELLVAAPKVLAVLLVAIVGIVMLETLTSNVKRWDFVQLETEPAVSPSGEETVDSRKFAKTNERIVRMPAGDLAVVRPGVIPFLARVFGGASRLQNAEKIRTTLDETGSSKTSQMVLVHPDAEEPLDYDREGFSLSFFGKPTDPHADAEPELQRAGLFKTLLGTVAAWFVAGTLLAAPFPSGMTGWAVVGEIFLSPLAIGVGLVAFAVLGLEATDTCSNVVPAPAHLTSAFASSSVLAEETIEGETIEEFAEENRQLRIRDQREIEERVAEGERTLIEEMHGYDPDDRERSDGSESTNGSDAPNTPGGDGAREEPHENGRADDEEDSEVFGRS